MPADPGGQRDQSRRRDPACAYGLAGTARRPDDAVAISFRRARVHGGVRVSYLAGGVLGAVLALHWDLWSLTLPLPVLAVLIGMDVARRA